MAHAACATNLYNIVNFLCRSHISLLQSTISDFLIYHFSIFLTLISNFFIPSFLTLYLNFFNPSFMSLHTIISHSFSYNISLSSNFKIPYLSNILVQHIFLNVLNTFICTISKPKHPSYRPNFLNNLIRYLSSLSRLLSGPNNIFYL